MLRGIRRKRSCRVNICTDFSRDLRSSTIFKYLASNTKESNFEPNQIETVSLSLDIYQPKRSSINSSLKNLNFTNQNLTSSFFKEDKVEMGSCYRNLPYLDCNDNYIRSLITNYTEKNLTDSLKPRVKIIIDSKRKDKRKMDSIEE